MQFNVTNAASFEKFKRYVADYKVDGIICIEFFESQYIAELTELGIALIFLDFPITSVGFKGNCDIALPESRDSVKKPLRTADCRRRLPHVRFCWRFSSLPFFLRTFFRHE